MMRSTSGFKILIKNSVSKLIIKAPIVSRKMILMNLDTIQKNPVAI